MTSCDDKLNLILQECNGNNEAICVNIRAIINNNANDVDDMWGADESLTFTWQMIGIAILGVWLCYWAAWFWMAGGLGTTTTTQKIGEKRYNEA